MTRANRPKGKAPSKKSTRTRRTSAAPKPAAPKPAAPKPAAPKPAAPKPAIGFEVAVCESNRANQERARALLVELGYRVAAEQDEAAIAARLRSSPPRAVLVGLPERAGLIAACARVEPDRPVVIAALPAPASTARARTETAGADLFAVRPHGRDSLAASLQAAEKIAVLRDRVTALRGSEELLRERLQRYGQSDLATGFFHIEFFEHVLLMELKRAKRYGYTLAACLVALDAWREPVPPSAPVRRRLRSVVATTIASIVRDIDMPVDLTEDRMLIFLPFTDLDGATRVGRRIAGAVSGQGEVSDGARSWRPAVSIGIAALRPGKPVSFARLMRDATTALRAAQLKGGDRVVVRT
jgi:diguanylate cyclase (GGDEF)-like protein